MIDKQTPQESQLDYSALVVDLDGTLVATDTLMESAFLYLKTNPLSFFHLFIWLLKGKAHFKDQLAQRVCPEASTLPFRQEVLGYIGRIRALGKPVMLATASNRRVADRVARHLGLFSEVLASDAETNLSGQRKLEAIRARTGEKPFAYIGNASVDIPLWKAADTAVLVDPPSILLKRLEGHQGIDVLPGTPRQGKIQAWLKALRVHQWSKNFLIFLPAIMAHRVLEPIIFQHLVIAFLAMSFSASAIYLLNDLLDLQSDRQHVRKKYRPLAAGTFSINKALLLIPTFLILSYGIAFSFLPLSFLFALLTYLLLTSLYSFYLKQRIIVDVILLAALYTFRVIIGAIAVNILVSSWLLAFSMFFFLSLALMKRYSELLTMHEDVRQMPGRGYLKFDSEAIMATGVASGQLSLLVFALFMSGADMQELYASPQLLWFVLPVLFFWITRLWMLAHRGEVVEDPIVFTIKDRVSYVALGIIILIMTAASQLSGDIFPVSFLVQ